MWIYANPNPCRAEEPDCVVRAISLATGRCWDRVHAELCALSREVCSMPSVNWVWGLYLRKRGFTPMTVTDLMTVREFCKRNPSGTYVIGTGSHAVAVMSGDYYDAWDSGDEIPSYFWKKKGAEKDGL